jgi:hypothetical protein
VDRLGQRASGGNRGLASTELLAILLAAAACGSSRAALPSTVSSPQLQRFIDERLPPLTEVALAASALAELRHGQRAVGVDALKRIARR